MHVISTYSRHVIHFVASTALLVIAGNVAAQSAADNIRPVARVCLAGQPCVGSVASASSGAAVSVPSPAAAASTPPPAATAAAGTAAPSTQPTAVATPPVADEPAFDAAAAYQQSCFACHASGAAGAPLLGDQEAWEARLEKGMDMLMSNVIDGLNAMPARGLCVDCSDEDLRAIVDYMLEQ